MAAPIDWQVQHTSVVLVAESLIEPQSIAADMLKSKQITPPDWTVVSEISLPVFAKTEYSNGVQIRAEGNRCIFQQDLSGSLLAQYDIHQVAINYSSATELVVRYQAVGINWQLTAQLAQGHRLFQSMINSDKDLSGFQANSIRLTKTINENTCNINLTANQNAITVEVNYHHEVHDISLKDILSNWPSCQKNLKQEVMDVILT